MRKPAPRAGMVVKKKDWTATKEAVVENVGFTNRFTVANVLYDKDSWNDFEIIYNPYNKEADK